MDLIWKILFAAAVASVSIFMEILACVAFPVAGGGGSEWTLLFLLIPAFLTPLPAALLVSFSSSDDAFAESPRGRHWAEFLTAFIGVGVVAVPALLLLKHTIRWEAVLLAFGGLALPCLALLAAWCWKRRAGEEDDSGFLGF